MEDPRHFPWYMTFVSIVFGFSISIWGQPLDDVLKPDIPLPMLMIVRGTLMFVILVCLWWWYGMFLGATAPARGFFMYAWDFFTLGAFALAARVWNRDDIFQYTVLTASILMFARFAVTYRSLMPSSKEREALQYALVALTLTVIFLTGGFVMGGPSRIDIVLLISMSTGIAATLGAVYKCEGLTWADPNRLGTQPMTKLVFAAGCMPPGITPDDLGRLFAIVNRAKKDYVCEVEGASVPGARRTHLSNVHTEDDTDVQAILLALPSIHDPECMKQKAYFTYVGHWVDDHCDQSFRSALQKHEGAANIHSFVAFCGSVKGRPFENVVRHLLEKTSVNSLQEYGLHRLLVGAAIFVGAEEDRARFRQIHKELLKQKLGSELDNLYIGFSEEVIDLTCKTVQELWFGLEKPAPEFRLSFIYSILFAPALYFHDAKEEERRGEMTPKWGPLGEEQAIHAIQKAAEMASAIDDPLRELRAWQVESLALSFISVLPHRVFVAYNSAAKTIGRVKSKHL